ncbi:MAG: hypothetical protein Ta2F_16740 [Termitinemataceae bacterium]|nr:MAG: hypothetical protein Ta2F_16740 [Termitinemataceae bacterium]
MGVENQEKLIAEKFEKMAVPMDKVEYTPEEYRRLFPRNEVQTPIGTFKMGKDFFDKLGRKDEGARKELLGASFQTLTDPLIIIRETKDGITSDVYIKSFNREHEEGFSFVMAVSKPID